MFEVLVVVASKALVYGLLLLVFCWCLFQWKNWDLLQAARKMPCTIKAYPIIGHAYAFLNGWEGVTKTLIDDISNEAVSSGLYNVCLWLGPRPLILIHKLEDIQKILTKTGTTEKGDGYNYLKWALGDGLITAKGDIWNVTRRQINPMFHPRNLNQLLPAFNKNSREMIMNLAEHMDNKTFNVLHPAERTALKSICQLLQGTELILDTESDDFKAVFKLVVEDGPLIMARRIFTPWLRIDFIFEFLYRKEIHYMREIMMNRCAELQIEAGKSVKSDKLPCTKEDSGFLSLINVYSEMKNKYPHFATDDYLREEGTTLFAAGTDTTGLTTATCLLVLGHHHDIQDRVYEEINSVVGPDDDVTTDHIRRMQYLDQVYRETLRWGVIAPYVSRKTSENITLSTCTIPAGNSVLVGLIGPLMDPSIFPDPHKFDPERFSPENSTSRSKQAFIPFSTGPRNCIGKIYTEFLVKTMLVHVLRTFRVSTKMDIYNLKKTYTVTLVNSEGYNIELQNRN